MIDEAISFVRELFKDDFTGHDFDHTMRVYKLSIELSKNLDVDIDRLSLIALLHDVDDYKLFKDSEDHPNARRFLNSFGYKDIEPILNDIDDISFKGTDSKIPSTIEGKIAQDADRLDALGAIGIARAFAYGGSHKRKLYDEDDKNRSMSSFSEYKSSNSSTRAHFYEKLLHLKDMMNTIPGKREAIRRTDYMSSFLDELEKEI